jgi:DNA-binding MarR family transcriptional regulator
MRRDPAPRRVADDPAPRRAADDPAPRRAADGSERVTAWSAVLRVHAAVVPRLERELARVGMPLPWYDVLLELNAAPDRRLRMSELGARAVLSRERVSRVVDELERAGLARRERNPEDGRSLLAVVTDEGRARLRAAAPTYLGGIERHFGDHLTDDEARTVAAALLRAVEAQEPTGSPPRGRPAEPGAPRAPGGSGPGHEEGGGPASDG